jgi:hypothetical protein
MNGGRRYKYSETARLICRFWFNIIIIVVCLGMALWYTNAGANSGGGTTGAIGGTLTVQEIEDRADITWTINTVEQWVIKDEQFCRAKAKLGSWSATPSVSFVSCMHERLAARLLYMLRRNCVGVSAIGELCRMEVK